MIRYCPETYHSGTEFDADREVMNRLETLVGELEQETALAHAGVSDDNIYGGVRASVAIDIHLKR